MTKPDVKIKYSSQEIDNLGFDEDFHLPITEGGGFDGVNIQRINASNMSIKIEYDANDNPIYLGFASPGTAITTALWQIRKLTFDANNNITSMAYANGSPNFDSIWNARDELDYS
ncbi:MAG: hypothetical protein KJ888_20745 [Gammaproteobacteria bacterium]|uniref:Uncharacterized protein n=1 Tax=viral metagenome TaxID=1070528 RepID=A0A6M3KCK2_9ZZZZ|nr:hypothetical protein [Gammaproteobacteria bacterium]